MKKYFLSIVLLLLVSNIILAQKLGELLKVQAEEGIKQAAEKSAITAADKVLNKLLKKKEKTSTSGSIQNENNGINNHAVPQLPASISFERMVIQQMNGEEGNITTTCYFTIDGDYALVKKEQPGEDVNSALYTKEGHMCLIDEKKKVIQIFNMPAVIGEGAQAGYEIVEKINKKPILKDDEEKMTVTKTGKTKIICGYTSFEYEVKNDEGKSSWWYAKVDFNPIKIYTMGSGNKFTPEKLKNNESLKNNPLAIPVLNQNFLFAEIEVAGKKGMETKSITKTGFVFTLTGYTIKNLSNKGLKEIILNREKD